MAFPQQFLDELIARNDIVDVVSSYVTLTKKGANYFGLCPFHSEKTGSFSVSPDKQIYHCFGCKKGGGVVSFIMEEENLSFPDAVRFLAKRANIPVPEEEQSEGNRLRSRILELNREAARFYYDLLQSPRGEACREYLNTRKITQKTAVNFGLGASVNEWDVLFREMTRRGYTKAELLASGLVVNGKNGGAYDKFRNRLIFPVIDARGDVVGFGGRVVDKNDPGAKYMNTPETVAYSKRRVLYGLNLAKKSKRENILLVEGNIDVVMLHQAGFDNACASMGTALTSEQVRLLSRYTKELILCYDNDDAGKVATQKALSILNDTDFSVRVLELPKRLVDGQYVKQDADDFIKFQGKDAFERLLSGSESGSDFRLARIASQFDLSSDRGKIDFSAAAADFLASLPNAVEREVYTAKAAELAGITAEALRMEAQRAYKRRAYRQKKEQERKDLNISAAVQPKERSIRYDNLRSARAEEGIIRLLVQDESVFGSEPPLREEEFSSPLLGRLYTRLWQQRSLSGTIRLPQLDGIFEPEEISHLSAIVQQPESLKNAQQALGDYIAIIQTEAQKRSAAAVDPLLAATEKYKSKGHGGK
ncbi:MAG: DNA primase [Oscillospiraceae bacterium]|nr:DNA primase [Oscillospiraceae bacterium]